MDSDDGGVSEGECESKGLAIFLAHSSRFMRLPNRSIFRTRPIFTSSALYIASHHAARLHRYKYKNGSPQRFRACYDLRRYMHSEPSKNSLYVP